MTYFTVGRPQNFPELEMEACVHHCKVFNWFTRMSDLEMNVYMGMETRGITLYSF